MKAITFTIKLLEPLLATGLEGDPNTGVSMNYISGSVLRGAVIGLYLKENNQSELSLNTKERQLFFNETVRYLNSYPLAQTITGEERTFPTPLAWQKKKDYESEKDFINFAIAEREKGNSFKSLKYPFFAFQTSNDIVPISTKNWLAVHTQRDAEKGRATEDNGAVFRYESIAGGTKFKGAVLCEDNVLLTEIKVLVEKHKKVTFGGSRSAGYGKAEFCEVLIDTDWQEFKQNNDIAKDDEFSVYLLGNVLLKDEKGSYKSEITAADLGLNAEKIKEKTFIQTELVGGFNQKWGLPLPQMLSIKAGSVFTFKALANISKSNLQTIVENGIGEKLVEGFGRIAFDLTKQNPVNEEAEQETNVIDKILTNAEDIKIRNEILDRILRQKLDSELSSIVAHKTLSNGLTNSQISRFRMFIKKMLFDRNYEISNLDKFFKDLKSDAKDKFQKAKIDSISLETWSKQNRFSSNWSLNLGGKAVIWEDLKAEYHLRLIDGVLAKKAKGRENND